jgi:hypothetical protein
MNNSYLHPKILALGLTGIAAAFQFAMAASPDPNYEWSTVVNNGDFMPTDLCNPTEPNPTTPPCRKFNSYNQPSVNANGLVVMRARSRGGQGLGEPVHGVYTRDMANSGPVTKILDRNTLVSQPNNRDTVFIEPPSFPRIDIGSNTIATRGNHQPVWKVLDENGDILEQLGTTGIYTNPFGDLITGASKLGPVPDFSFFEVPEAPGTPFDVFPGAPAVTDANTIVFKGNYTVNGVGKTGVYYRTLRDEPILLEDMITALAPAGGELPVVLIANNTSTLIPGTDTVFGSTAPPSAADRKAVFAGFDDEDKPTLGGIYLAPLTGPEPPLKTLVSIGSKVPGESKKDRFNKLGEGVSFDGRFVAFWGAWGTETKTLVLQCPTEGNAARIVFCNEQHPNGFTVQVPVHQGIFVHDTKTNSTIAIAKTPTNFNDFMYWNFSGRVPGSGEGDDDGEPARWRSTAFVAISGLVDGSLIDATFHAAFKARSGEVVNGAYIDPVDGIYLRKGPGQSQILNVVRTAMDGTLIDPEAVFVDEDQPVPPVSLPVTEMGIERDGFRGNSLVVNVSMGTEEAGWAGVYLTRVPSH